jgi:uncharacterized membrane protein YecN with MAPEG domain
MNSQKTGLCVASIFFGLFAIAHVFRLINAVPVQVGNHQIPMGVSWVALIVAAIVCIWLWRLASRSGTKSGAHGVTRPTNQTLEQAR